MSSLGTNMEFGEKKSHYPRNKKKEIKLNKECKDKESTEIKSLQRMVKELTNTIIYLKNNTRECLRRPFKPWKEKTHNQRPE